MELPSPQLKPCTLPNLIIAGVHKAGTTSLYSYLAKHPEICPSFKKEIGFFMPLIFDEDIPPIQEYSHYFCHCAKEKYRMEASPSYVYGKEKIAEAIKRQLKDVKIVVVLRDPTDRLVSFFNRAVSRCAVPKDMEFKDYLARSAEKLHSSERDVVARGVREGIYIDYIGSWQRIFEEDLKIVFFDDLKHNALGLTVDICKWLALDTSCFEPQDFTVENRTLQYRHRKLHSLVKNIYMKYEPFWRRNYILKKRLRTVYNFFNAGNGGMLQTVDEASVSKARAMYEPHNRELRSFLEAHGYKSLPAWLT